MAKKADFIPSPKRLKALRKLAGDFKRRGALLGDVSFTLEDGTAILVACAIGHPVAVKLRRALDKMEAAPPKGATAAPPEAVN